MNVHKTQLSRRVDTKEAARILEVSPDTVRRWAKAGKIPVVRLPSRHFFFYEDDILALLEPRVGGGSGVANEVPLPGLEEER